MHFVLHLLGIIPAYAGNTTRKGVLRHGIWDHPRVCGEHVPLQKGRHRGLGSSPRMRGTQAMMLPAVSAAGIIPAYAGNTLDVHWSSPFVRDHPRVCGEHVRDWRGGVRLGGSSPRMRGTRARRGHSGHGIGIIPAYAGNTNVWPFAAFLHRDHPRVCGEHRMLGHKSAAMTGSSPRMRGTLFVRLGGGAVTGIIPAYAGNTIHVFNCIHLHRDHPRVCGEHESRSLARVTAPGSSPRMRGTLHQAGETDRRSGIIPAYAGNTSSLTAVCLPV